MSRRVSFSPEPTTTLYTKHGATKDSGGNKRRMILKIWTFKLPKGSRFSPARFFRHISAKAVRAQSFVSARRQCWHKVSSANLTKSHSYVETLDSHRAEAIEDCIEFLNSSNASLQRSNSARSSCAAAARQLFCIIIIMVIKLRSLWIFQFQFHVKIGNCNRDLKVTIVIFAGHVIDVMCCWANLCNLITQSH